MGESGRNFRLPFQRSLFLLLALVVLPAAAAIASSGHMERTKLLADVETVRYLNTATTLYAVRSSTHEAEVFAGITSDEGRLGALVTAGLYDSVPQPQSKNGQFLWHEEARQWTYSVIPTTEKALTRLLSFGRNKSELTIAP